MTAGVAAAGALSSLMANKVGCGQCGGVTHDAVRLEWPVYISVARMDQCCSNVNLQREFCDYNEWIQQLRVQE